MFKKYFWITQLLVLAVFNLPAVAQFGDVLYNDEFDELSNVWSPIGINGANGTVEAKDGSLSITAGDGDIFGTYYSPTSFSGHFEAILEFDEDHGVALALLKDVGGEPSLNDYSMLTVMTNENGHPEVHLTDIQNGARDVFDNTSQASDDKFTHLLDGNVYSLPFKKTAGKLRILRHAGQQFIHLFYAVNKEEKGEVFEDWIELSPSKEWGAPNADYFVGIFSLGGTTTFNKVTISQLPLRDQDDTDTGFAATFRPFTWSGFTDDALVVTFGDAFPFKGDDRKFVFWELANNVPVWKLDDGALFSHGFHETWNEPEVLGCIEPMSDRLLAFSDVALIEDNDVRKVVKWSYVIVNPNYKIPGEGKGEEEPEVTEYYYIYADGNIIRRSRYVPNLDTDFRSWYEVAELIVIAGENQRPRQLYKTPSLTIHELGEDPETFTNTGEKRFENGSERLGAVTLTAHVVGAPDLFYAFSDDRNIPETFSNIPFSYDVTWQHRNHNFG
ncbi:MAG: hypothetical protein AAFO69_12315, partial [Bacteroidota bacterium]